MKPKIAPVIASIVDSVVSDAPTGTFKLEAGDRLAAAQAEKVAPAWPVATLTLRQIEQVSAILAIARDKVVDALISAGAMNRADRPPRLEQAQDEVQV